MDDFQSAFNEADEVFVTPVYEAGEEPIDGVSSHTLVEGLKSRGHRAAASVADMDELVAVLGAELKPDDLIVCLGAGDITRWAAELPDALQKERAR